jgi:transposase
VDWENDYIGFLDTTSVQNIPNTVRTLYVSGTKHRMMKNPKKFKINETGFLGLNCKSKIFCTKNTRAHEMGKIITEIRLANTNSFEGQSLLFDVLVNPNLTDEYVSNTLKRKRDSPYEYRETIIDKIYDEKTNYESTNKNIINYAKRQDHNNIDKKDKEKQMNLLKNLNTEEIKNIFKNESKLHIILDNYSVHHTPLIENIALILNINLIFLPPYSPDLNPIEDIWDPCKETTKKSYIIDEEHLKIMFEDEFYKQVQNKSYTENWEEEYANISVKS